MTSKNSDLVNLLNHSVGLPRHDVHVQCDSCSLNNDLVVELDTSAHCSRDADCVVCETCCDECASCSAVQPCFNDAYSQSLSPNCPERKLTSSNLTKGCKNVYNRQDTISNDVTDKDINDLLFNQSDYYHDISDVNAILDKVSGDQQQLLMMHFNVRSLAKNIDKVSYFLSQLNKRPDIIAVTETILCDAKCGNNIELLGYKFVHSDSLTKAGGVGLYIIESLAFNFSTTLKLNVDHVEDIWISFKIKQKSYVVGVVYRHPIYIASHMKILTEKLQNLFLEINSTKTEFYALGDFNIDLLQLKTNKTICMYAENLLASSMKCLIDKPTRIADTSKTLIDHIYTNNLNSSLISGICINDISDHFPILVIAPTNKPPQTKFDLQLIRNFKNFDVETFGEDLTTSLSNFAVTDTKPINDQLSEFLKIFAGIVNEHAPLRPITRKEKKIES